MKTESPETSAAPTRGRARWRWWVHLVLIGGYFIPATVMSLTQIRERPALTSNVRGLLIVCAFEIVVFAVVFGLGWSASRASRQEMFLIWRPGWWVAPLGFAYAILLRIGVAICGFVFALVLLSTHIWNQDSLRKFAADNQPAVERLIDIPAMRNDSVYFWLTVTLVSFVVAGLREEMWRAGTLAAMKALWPRLFGSRAGQWTGMALIAVVFGAAHFADGNFGRRLREFARLVSGRDNFAAPIDLGRSAGAWVFRCHFHGAPALRF